MTAWSANQRCLTGSGGGGGGGDGGGGGGDKEGREDCGKKSSCWLQ